MLGPLPEDFLRVNGINSNENGHVSQEDQDRAMAMALQRQFWGGSSTSNLAGQLNISVVRANMVKNYGFTRMDPYVRIRVGHTVYETHTDPNGAKSPVWNKTFACYLPVGVDSIYLEIYDECSLTPDELIGWSQITIPANVFTGETVDDWYALNGKQGEGQEGSVNIVFSFARVGTQSMVTQVPIRRGMSPYTSAVPVQQVLMVPGGYPVQEVVVPSPGATAPGLVTLARPPRAASPQFRPMTEEEISEMKDMFPETEIVVIQGVYEACRGNKAATVENLLQMSGQS
ncbi:hypothetical protein QYM36_006577 [Artemia franciscana]|uniref:Toll-interacting protein n=2 Tax=Artemia franciscana TaxID=6661 RepID=A0AA88LA10_ARTSF|nr:hypothetical protein QYM36_006577 [Artemia franciscana]